MKIMKYNVERNLEVCVFCGVGGVFCTTRVSSWVDVFCGTGVVCISVRVVF